MASTQVLLLQLLLVSLASASHHYGGTVAFTYKGRNPDGTLQVDLRTTSVFKGCYHHYSSYCYSGTCGYVSRRQRGVVDSNTNASYYSTGQWCETETFETWKVPNDRSFQMRISSCCWVRTRNSLSSWNLLTFVDLGTRSDTGQPNRSPDVAILHVLRVPQNCPRTYRMMAFDPDGDRVRCRYGNIRSVECSTCHQPPGFYIDQDSCTIDYQSASYDTSRVFGFEMVVEDFPHENVILSYSDGSRSSRAPLSVRSKRQAYQINSTYQPPATSSWWWGQGATTTTGPSQTRIQWWWPSTPTPTTTAPTTPPQTTTTPWWWWPSTPTPTTTAPTTTPQTTTTPWWWWPSTPTPTTTAPTTPPQTTTTPWWWWPSTPTPTTTAPTTPPQTTTTPWWWWPSTPTPTTTAPTTTPQATTLWWWWRHSTTTSTTTTTTTATTTPQATTTPRTTHLYATTAPLSKLPLQFSVFVDPPIPSCQEGYYLPMFVAPTPQNGARIQAEVNKEVDIRVKAQAAYATIQNIFMTGPLNISRHRTTHNEFVIRWTPTPDNMGEHFPVCFAVESVSGSRIYQSEMRCVLVDVGKEQIKSNVICNESTMTVEVEKSTFAGLHEEHLRLIDPSQTVCSLQTHSNSTHVIGVIPLNACGTEIEEDEDNLIFKNEITTFDITQNTITRHHLLEVRFYCQYPKRGNVTLGFTAHRKNVTVWDKGFGTFTYNFEFFPNNQYQTMIDPNSYPLEYDLGNRIYMQIDTETSVNNTDLFVESCRATPYDNPNSRPSYTIIENGCTVDSTIQTYPTINERQFRFSMEAFKFIGLHDQVYISCSVMMCEAGNPDTRCSQGCVNSTSNNRRGKREIVTQTLMHRISQGPLRLKRSAERTESPVMNLNLNLVFIAGCLLAAVGMVSAVVMYKAKVSRVKYQPLPTFEN
ncbi:hypothetical protein D5F01_LYC04393 [Larimichthys crocea]|uniref:ZP domain-containing protein n=1 Tax=Larimichthys crocea TaxID=215358 RepID=A0A6G0J2Q4_LARCR|nr:hypothetical protein D5F01_LYC04393 [Larimichthys crocea]